MSKEARQKKISDLLQAERIGTQEELTAWLERAGFSVTQASVSRDLAELNVVKRNGCTHCRGRRRVLSRMAF